MIKTHFFPRAALAVANGVEPIDLVGYTPEFLSEEDERDAVTQLNENYEHGGGWRQFDGFSLAYSLEGNPELHYDDDPITEAVAQWELRDEKIVLFDHAWVAVIQPDGSFRVARMD
jgi:hypothetical protein